jgi:DNA-directed RNA polymerase specialized sigma24 family protein
MRWGLIENARRKKSAKYGGNRNRIDLNEATPAIENPPVEDLIALDEALEKLAEIDRVKADLVKLRFFSGLTNDQAAKVLDITLNTADRYWAYGRAWLRLEVRGRQGSDR